METIQSLVSRVLMQMWGRPPVVCAALVIIPLPWDQRLAALAPPHRHLNQAQLHVGVHLGSFKLGISVMSIALRVFRIVATALIVTAPSNK